MMKKFAVIVLALSLVFVIASEGMCVEGPVKKLGRGICNVVTSPFELFAQPSKVNDSDGPMAGMTVGILKGVYMTCARAVVGAYEIATFPIPLPKDYKPILTEPEFFFEEMNW